MKITNVWYSEKLIFKGKRRKIMTQIVSVLLEMQILIKNCYMDLFYIPIRSQHTKSERQIGSIFVALNWPVND